MTTPKYAIEWNRDTLVADRQTIARLMLLADALVDSSELHEAENCYRQAVFLAEQLDDEDDTRCDLAVSFGLLLMQLNKHNEAEQWLRQAESLIDTGKVKAQNHSEVYETWTTFYRHKDEPETADRYARLAKESFASITADLRRRVEAAERRSVTVAEDCPTVVKSMEESQPGEEVENSDVAEKHAKWEALMKPMMVEETKTNTPDGSAQASGDAPKSTPVERIS